MSLFADKISIQALVAKEPLTLPIIRDTAVKAGFPSPALDYMQDAIDLNQLLIFRQHIRFTADYLLVII